MRNTDLKELDINEVIDMANNGDSKAMNELVERCVYGESDENDKKKTFEFFNKSSENYIEAKYNLAKCYYFSWGTEQNDQIAFEIFTELAEKHNLVKSYCFLGEYYFWGYNNLEIDYEKAFSYYNKVVEYEENKEGEVEIEYLKSKLAIACAYDSGKGVEKDNELAFNMLKELVEKYNYPSAYFWLGQFYYYNKGVVKQEYEKAFSYFSKSLEYKENVANSKYVIGEMYMLGRGVEADAEKAKMYFEDVLDKLTDEVYYKLALLYSGDYGLEKDEEKAKEYIKKIELDLCETLIIYIIALRDEDGFKQIIKILESEIELVKLQIPQFPLDHPIHQYYNKIKYFLKTNEYYSVTESLKNKIIAYIKENKNYEEEVWNNISSFEDIEEMAKSIVEIEI